MSTTSYDSLETVSRMIDRLENHLKAKKVDLANRKLYEPTRLKLAKVAERLEACANLAYELSKSSHVVDVEASYKAKQDYIERQKKGAMKQVAKMDNQNPVDSYLDFLVAKQASPLEIQSSSSYSACSNSKQIMWKFHRTAEILAYDEKWKDVPEVKKCGALLSQWVQIRFAAKPDAKFHYNVYNIPIWIDKFLYSFAYHWKYLLIGKFQLDLEEWLSDIVKEDQPFPLPKSVFYVEEDGEDIYCPEAIYLERTIKSVMYSNSFFPERINSLENEVTMHFPELQGKSDEEIKSLCHIDAE